MTTPVKSGITSGLSSSDSARGVEADDGFMESSTITAFKVEVVGNPLMARTDIGVRSCIGNRKAELLAVRLARMALLGISRTIADCTGILAVVCKR